jgi:hypothetical protein
VRKCLLVVAALVLCSVAPVRAADDKFTGTWDTTFGEMTMVQKEGKVVGTYYGGKAKMDGIVDKHKVVFTYVEKGEKGEGEFDLAADGKSFTGKYRLIGGKEWLKWKGTKK